MALSHESKRVLAYGAEESERMGFRHIGTDHLVLGLLREQDTRAARILRDRGLEIGAVREKIARLTRPATQISEKDPHRIVYQSAPSHWDAAPHELRAVLSTTSRSTGIFDAMTETARRSIFFARYEASQAGSLSIETEHLLLGLLREDRALSKRLLPDDAKIEEIRTAIGHRHPARTKISTAVDLPLSEEVRKALGSPARKLTGSNTMKSEPCTWSRACSGVRIVWRQSFCTRAGSLWKRSERIWQRNEDTIAVTRKQASKCPHGSPMKSYSRSSAHIARLVHADAL
jgi:ATP-dependent Clp protease ATP-binding subunit ClpA